MKLLDRKRYESVRKSSGRPGGEGQVIRMNTIQIIAEIGINHGGSAEIARELIAAAAAAQVTGVKFQYRNLENAYSAGADQIGDEILRKEITKNYLPPAVIVKLVHHAKELGIQAGISFFDAADMDDFRTDLADFDFYKVPSAELCNMPLIHRMLQEGKPVMLSTGCHKELEIEEVFSKLPGDNWIPMHCVSNYPVVPVNAKLGYLKHLARRWKREIGYSSHDESWEVCLLAMQLGATVIERHITFDKNAQGLDHSTSSTPDEFQRLTEFSENLELILAGDGPRYPNQGEMLNLQNLGRSFYATKDFEVGEVIVAEQCIARAPRTGIGRHEMAQYLGRSAVRPVRKGEVINRSVFEISKDLSDEVILFAQSKRVSLPVRLHDQRGMQKKFPIGRYEFHLSFGEVLSAIDVKQYDSTARYSIHLPDYVSSTQLMDPFSEDVTQRTASQDILNRTVAFAAALQDRTGAAVPVVGSFSVVHGGRKEFFETHAQLLWNYRRQGVAVLPQWLPPIAWYFGGSVRLNAMNGRQDVEFIEQYELPICMDICHLCMGESTSDFVATEVLRRLRPYIRHLHIADAMGIDGEGMLFGDGDPKNMAALREALRFDEDKVVEVWQGHLDGGAGFAKSLVRLWELFDASH